MELEYLRSSLMYLKTHKQLYKDRLLFTVCFLPESTQDLEPSRVS